MLIAASAPKIAPTVLSNEIVVLSSKRPFSLKHLDEDSRLIVRGRGEGLRFASGSGNNSVVPQRVMTHCSSQTPSSEMRSLPFVYVELEQMQMDRKCALSAQT